VTTNQFPIAAQLSGGGRFRVASSVGLGIALVYTILIEDPHPTHLLMVGLSGAWTADRSPAQ
jgi:hypothetical protein